MKRSAKRHTFKPTMEALETRWCPATSVSPLQNGVVTITGDDANNTVIITQNDNANRLTIQVEDGLAQVEGGPTLVDSLPFVFASDQVTDVVINLRGGHDQLTYQLGGGSDFVDAKRITADLGSGDDGATFNFFDSGGDALARVRGRLDITVQGQAGKDQVDAVFGTLVRRASLTGNMGFGNDRFTAELKGSLLAYSNLQIDMEDMNDLVIRDPLHPWITLATIPGGNDDFRVTCDAGVALAREAALDVTLKGLDGNDTLQFQYQGEVDGFVTVLLDGEDGADTVLANIALDNASTGTANATVLGGNGNDNLTLRISNLGTGTVQGLLNGGDGFDNFNKTLNVTDQNCEIGVFF